MPPLGSASTARPAALPLSADLTRLDTGSALKRVKSPPVDIPISLPLLPRWDELAAWMRQIDRSRVYTNRGPLCAELERRLELHYLGEATPGGSVCLSASGTLGLVASLLALDLEPGSSCMLPSWTFIATASAVAAAGLTPYLADVDLETWAMHPDQVETELASMDRRPSVIVPVSPFGAPVDTAAWLAFSRESGIAVVVDAAASFDSVTPCELPTVVSLHATKPLGVGEGGFVVCTDQTFVERLKQATNFGFTPTRVAHRTGINAKLSEYHAAIGLAQLEKWRETRRTWLRVASAYRRAFDGHPRIALLPGYGRDWVGSTAVFRFCGHAASALADDLNQHHVQSRRWWQRGVSHHPAFADCAAGDLANSETLAGETLALPCYLTLRDSVVKQVVESVIKVVGRE